MGVTGGSAAPLRLEARYRFKDVVEENAATIKVLYIRLIIAGMLAGAVLVSLQPQRTDPPPRDLRTRVLIGVSVPAAMFVPVAVFLPWVGAVLPWYLIPDRRTPWPIVVDGSGVSMAYGEGPAKTIPWDQLTHFTETPSLLLLWKPKSPLVIPLPKRDLEAAGVLGELREIVERRLTRSRWTRPAKQNLAAEFR